MYKLFVDKPIVFECTIELDGASINETVARLVIEAPDRHLLFTGTVNSEGVCSIPVNKLHGILGENVEGKMKLEVIAEDTYFQPWHSPFIVERARKVTVEVKEPVLESKPTLRVEVKEPPRPKSLTPTQKLTLEIAADLRANGITTRNAVEKKSIVFSTIQEHLMLSPVTTDVPSLISNVVKQLAKKSKE